MFHFQRVDPSPVLQDYVKGYWLMEKVANAAKVPLYLVPEGFPELMFHLNGNFETLNEQKRNRLPAACLLGQLDHTLQFDATLGSRVFLVKLYPWVPHFLFPLSQKECTNRQVDLECLGNPRLMRQIASRIRSADSFKEAIVLIESFLMEELKLIGKNHPMLTLTTRQILRKQGRVAMEDLGAEVRYSRRYLERVFQKNLGLSPKRYARIIRNKAITCQMVNQEPTSWSAFAQDWGYFDQAHFIKDFKSITQQTPTTFVEYMKDFPIRQRKAYLDQYQ